MKFPMLQMLAEGKKKKKVDADAEMDFSMDDEAGDLDAAPAPKKGKKSAAPADDEMVVGKAQILKALPDLTPAERKAIMKKVTALVAADDEAAA